MRNRQASPYMIINTVLFNQDSYTSLDLKTELCYNKYFNLSYFAH